MPTEGFFGQRLVVLPASTVADARRAPVTRRLLVTDVGVFPRAAGHERERPDGTDRAVVLVCAEGRGWVETARGRREVLAGEFAILPAGVPHRYGAHDADPWSIWWLHVAGSDVDELLADDGSLAWSVRRANRLIEATALITEALEVLDRGLGPANLRRASGAAWHLLTSLADAAASASSQEVIEQAVAMLRRRLADTVTVAELAALANLSPSHFQVLFKAAVGMPVGRFHLSLRMQQARQLLDGGDLPISEVGVAVGYPDAAFFSRQFAKVHGTSPSAYRRQAKG
ncbi:AraC family transcriptional regulator [Agromyces italicus]|uniref:AraC family transcriptional regulator n=1 Tax=Agromyces italicus TaxID=279572 RepID=UPI00047B58BF|nr:AraC family transcriptional regulator [Agromyces italicus]